MTDLISDAYDAVLAFIDGAWVTETLTKLPEGTQPQISVDELLAAEATVRNDMRVQKLAAEQGLSHCPASCSSVDKSTFL